LYNLRRRTVLSQYVVLIGLLTTPRAAVALPPDRDVIPNGETAVEVGTLLLRAYMSPAGFEKVLGTHHLQAERSGGNWIVYVPPSIPRAVQGKIVVYAGGGTPEPTLSARDARVLDISFSR